MSTPFDPTTPEFLALPTTTGYKGTTKDLKCRDHQFEVNVWYRHDGDLELCKSGFHFCTAPSGPWSYYSDINTRIFKCEAKQVLESKNEPGTDNKKVACYIRITEEITPGGYQNSGNGNSGYQNSGNRNSGNRNSGDQNSGDQNSGNQNSGNRNSGNRNSGNRNSGDQNSGYRNSGNRNSGNRNSGNRNSGNRNSGNGNSGDGNATNNSSGFFCIEEPKVLCFDVQTELTQAEFLKAYPRYYDLCLILLSDDPIVFETFKDLPGITPEKLTALHDKFKAGRSK